MTLEKILHGYAEQMSDFLRAERLYRELMAHAYDGTEIYRVIDDALRGLGDERAAATIKRTLLEQYRNSIPVHVAVELTCKPIEDGELS